MHLHRYDGKIVAGMAAANVGVGCHKDEFFEFRIVFCPLGDPYHDDDLLDKYKKR